jgi:putative oxidoreductase
MDATAVDLGLLVLRLGVGLPFALHGAQKLFGWFGGGGPRGTAAYFASLGFGDGRAAAVLAGAAELLGGLGLAAGLLTPLAAAGVAGTMTTAALVNDAENGFWSAAKGWELNGYLVVVAVAVAVAGPGVVSLDAALGVGAGGDPVAGLAGAAVVLAGMAGGWLRWVTRRPAPGSAG